MRGSEGNGRGRLGAVGVSLLCALTLTGCSDALVGMSMPELPKIDDINPWAEKPVPLPGKRMAVIQQENIASNLSGADKPILLPPQRENAAWSQPGGIASNAPGHLAYAGAGKNAWSADAGTGSSFFGRLTASPIVYDDKVYTLDAAGKVTAFSAAGGAQAWRVSVTPPNVKDQKGFGGGLAADGGRIYVGTGYGTVVALDAKTGSKLWEKYLESPVRTSPTAAAERVFAVTNDGQVYCLSGSDGTELWTFRGTPERASLLSNASPAVDGDLVVVPYPSGDLVALRVADGKPAWSESLSRTRTGSSMAAMSDTARPAIDGGTVFAVGHAGRMVATTAEDRRAHVVADGAEQPGAVGRRRVGVRGRHHRPADGDHAPRRQDPVDRQAARRQYLVGAGAGRQPPVAHVQQGAPDRRRRHHRTRGDDPGPGPADLHRPCRGGRAHIRAHRQGQAARAQLKSVVAG